MTNHLENLISAFNSSGQLVDEIRETHSQACPITPTPADILLESALLPLISEACALRDKLNRLRHAFDRKETENADCALGATQVSGPTLTPIKFCKLALLYPATSFPDLPGMIKDGCMPALGEVAAVAESMADDLTPGIHSILRHSHLHELATWAREQAEKAVAA